MEINEKMNGEHRNAFGIVLFCVPTVKLRAVESALISWGIESQLCYFTIYLTLSK
jgi:hypothetical protein